MGSEMCIRDRPETCDAYGVWEDVLERLGAAIPEVKGLEVESRLVDWNDDPVRTEQEVLAVLDKVVANQ